jgi:hypothetical protein
LGGSKHPCPEYLFVDVQATRNYQRRHISVSVHSDYPDAGWRLFTNDLGVALPPPVVFSRLAGGLGIANGSYVVLVVTGGPERDMSSVTDHCQLTRDQRGKCHRDL